ncbi:MAG TPA: hypothetical protein VGI22_10135 [Xanthobacteraceae bacterium]
MAHESLPVLAHDHPMIGLLDDDPTVGIRALVPLAAQILDVAEGDHRAAGPCAARLLLSARKARLSRSGLGALESNRRPLATRLLPGLTAAHHRLTSLRKARRAAGLLSGLATRLLAGLAAAHHGLTSLRKARRATRLLAGLAAWLLSGLPGLAAARLLSALRETCRPTRLLSGLPGLAAAGLLSPLRKTGRPARLLSGLTGLAAARLLSPLRKTCRPAWLLPGLPGLAAARLLSPLRLTCRPAWLLSGLPGLSAARLLSPLRLACRPTWLLSGLPGLAAARLLSPLRLACRPAWLLAGLPGLSAARLLPTLRKARRPARLLASLAAARLLSPLRPARLLPGLAAARLPPLWLAALRRARRQRAWPALGLILSHHDRPRRCSRDAFGDQEPLCQRQRGHRGERQQRAFAGRLCFSSCLKNLGQDPLLGCGAFRLGARDESQGRAINGRRLDAYCGRTLIAGSNNTESAWWPYRGFVPMNSC